MKKLLLFAFGLALTAGGVTLWANSQDQSATKKADVVQPTKPDKARDETAILEAVFSYQQALNRGDAEALAKHFTEEAEFIDDKGQVTRLAALMTSAPALDDAKLDQIAALPLGGRIKLDPWGDHVEMIKAAPVAITSARDKMPFEVTPFFPRLTRLGSAASTGNAATAQNTGTGQP